MLLTFNVSTSGILLAGKRGWRQGPKKMAKKRRLLAQASNGFADTQPCWGDSTLPPTKLIPSRLDSQAAFPINKKDSCHPKLYFPRNS